MTNAIALVQPITAECDASAQILRMDSGMLRFQLDAGGDENGTLAMPALYEMVVKTARLKMALAGTLLIGDRDEIFEAWVESRWRNNAVHLTILSLRAIEEADTQLRRMDATDDLAGAFIIETDAETRIVGLSGSFPAEVEYRVAGMQLADFITLPNDAVNKFEKAVSREIAYHCDDAKLDNEDQSYSFDARPQFSISGELIGYSIQLNPSSQSQDDSIAISQSHNAIEAPTPFFGERLAPVLRQPIGRIIANAETIGARLKGPLRDNYASYAKDIADAAKHLSALVDDIGDLEAIERPNFKTAQDNVELGDAARRVSGLLALKAADHNIKITVPDEVQNVVALAEFRRVLQILLNLVNNAIRYSADGTEIKIEIAQLNQIACITVSDEGAGIPEEMREQVFEKFERLGRSGDGGSGLGLYISRRLSRAMNGDLIIGDSRSGGACFALTLPAAN